MQATLLIVPLLNVAHKAWVSQWLTEQNISPKPESDLGVFWTNPDQQPLSIELIRDLIKELQFFSVGNQKRWVVILNIDQGSVEAQNALLKTLEESISNTQFVITAQNQSLVLPTILSRCLIKHLSIKPNSDSPSSGSTLEQVEIKSFAQAIKLAADIPDRDSAQNQLTSWLVEMVESNVANYYSQIKIIKQALARLRQNGNVKLILESCFFQLKFSTEKS